MLEHLNDLFAAVARRPVALCTALPLALAGCGGGGGGDTSPESTYYAVEGTQSAGGVPVTVCLDGATYTDPTTAAGIQMSANLAEYFGLVGGYRTLAGTGASCREQFPAVNDVVTVDEYNKTVLVAVASGPSASPPPASPPAPSPPPPAPAPSAIACASAHGSGLDGLQLTGTSSYSGLSTAASNAGTVTFQPGTISFQNPSLTSTSTTGSLRARLWAVGSSYGGGSINGYVVSTYTIQFTDGGNTLTNDHTATLAARLVSAQTPPRGAYCLVATLEEYQPGCGASDGYCIADWSQFSPSTAFQ